MPLISYQLVRIAGPSVTIADGIDQRSRSDADFVDGLYSQTKPDIAAVPQLRKKLWDDAVRFERRDGFQWSLRLMLHALAGAIVFVLHWRLWRLERLKSIACSIG